MVAPYIILCTLSQWHHILKKINFYIQRASTSGEVTDWGQLMGSCTIVKIWGQLMVNGFMHYCKNNTLP